MRELLDENAAKLRGHAEKSALGAPAVKLGRMLPPELGVVQKSFLVKEFCND